VAATALLVVASPASASAYTCANSHGLLGATCMYVNGSGTYVSDTTIEHDDGNDWTNMCDIQVRAQYTPDNIGYQVTQYSSKRYGCFIYLSIRMDIKKTMRNPSYFYGEAYHDGAWAPGRPRVTIYK
jgi:hypothetical protein